MTKTSLIGRKMLDWHSSIDRKMPWKETTDAYKIWLSEVILQQTRVAQGLPYYLRFVEQYPTVRDLAAASQEKVLKLWQGLGYYSRARNMHEAARTIVSEHGGVFPNTYDEVLKLKGVGKYTAAAIMSFAYGERYPVVDGNVLRVISRLYGIHDAIDDPKTIKLIYALSDELITHLDPAKYNQAVMDLGALVCKPKGPLCSECALSEVCVAFGKQLTNDIPYKAKRIKKRTRYLHYLHITDDNNAVVLRHRDSAGIWQGLYDFPSVETDADEPLTADMVRQRSAEILGGPEAAEVQLPTKIYKHILTHQRLMVRFYNVKVGAIGNVGKPLAIVQKEAFAKYGVPVLIANYLDDCKHSLF